MKTNPRTYPLLFGTDAFADNAWKNFQILPQELKQFHPKLVEKPFIVALNKADLGIEKAEKAFKAKKQEYIATSAITGIGLKDLKKALGKLVPDKRKKNTGWGK